jgi:hypothetical protein
MRLQQQGVAPGSLPPEYSRVSVKRSKLKLQLQRAERFFFVALHGQVADD